MAIRKKIITAMKTEVITDPDRIPGSKDEIGKWYRVHEQGDIPDDVWKGPGEYLFDMAEGVWHRID